jgi:hypothetical protein
LAAEARLRAKAAAKMRGRSSLGGIPALAPARTGLRHHAWCSGNDFPRALQILAHRLTCFLRKCFVALEAVERYLLDNPEKPFTSSRTP